MRKRQPASSDRSWQRRIQQASPWPRCFYDLQHFKMGVSITISGSRHNRLSWEVCEEVPLSQNFGISTFGLSAFQTVVSQIGSHDWESCSKPPKHLRVNYRGAKGWSPSFYSSVSWGRLWSVLKRGTDRVAWSMSPSEPLAMLTLKERVTWSAVGGASFSPQVCIYCRGIQSSVLGSEGLTGSLSPALQVNQHRSRNLCASVLKAYVGIV